MFVSLCLFATFSPNYIEESNWNLIMNIQVIKDCTTSGLVAIVMSFSDNTACCTVFIVKTRLYSIYFISTIKSFLLYFLLLKHRKKCNQSRDVTVHA